MKSIPQPNISALDSEVTLSVQSFSSNPRVTMADKLRTLQQLEALQAKFVSTGHADTTRHEWTNNIVRDSYASYIGHPPLLEYMSLGMGESKEIVRAQMIEAMIRGAGKPPARDDD
jgi:splicing factor 3B subunit 5